jgi:DNA-binding NtrC family response regulator
MPFQLTIDLRDQTIRHTLEVGETIVGSSAGCEIKVSEPTVSRRHARIVVDGDRISIEDLNSSNGTAVEGRRIDGVAQLPVGAALTIGTVSARLEVVGASDLEPAVRFDLPEPEPVAAENPSLLTGAAGSARAFLAEALPRIIDRLEEDRDPVAVAQTVGAALVAHMPLDHLAVILSDAAHEGIVFLHGASAEATDPVVVEVGRVRITASFPHPFQARAWQSLLHSSARLVALSDIPSLGAPDRPRNPPAMPDPPTVDAAVRRIYTDAARIARGDVSVLITGESGTGKEILARYIHRASPVVQAPFVALNCAALPSDLLEAELFGVEKGVATGVTDRPGKFEVADGGTLFLDEVGDMAASTQAKILRVLQERTVHRLGGHEARPARVRVLAATNQDLGRLRETGAFRDDLYHRIADWHVHLPALRHRSGDIPNLAAHFLRQAATKRGLRPAGISRAALDLLCAHPWPGNIRELEREMARAALFLEDGELLQTRHLATSIQDGSTDAPRGSGLKEQLEQHERRILRAALRAHDDNHSAAARALGIGRTTLYRRMKELGL